MKTRICLAGATGWVGRAITASEKFALVAAIGKASAGQTLGDVIGIPGVALTISASVADALTAPCDVLIDYTHPGVVQSHVLDAIRRKVSVVIGTSGLTEQNFSEINELAQNNAVGVLAAGNFAITAVLLQRFAMMAAKYIPQWEIIDYAAAAKPDAPSGTAAELAAKLAQVQKPTVSHPIEKTIGLKEARGGTVEGSQIHSLRLPGFAFSYEITFGLPNERLLIRHDAGASAEPYVNGTLLAASKVGSFIGLRRGLDSILEE